jgi:plasmid stability protein
MPGVLIRDMPEGTHKKLKARAAANRRSLGREALVLLEKALEDPDRRPTLEEIDALRIKPRKTLTPEFILEAIRTGRS